MNFKKSGAPPKKKSSPYKSAPLSSYFNPKQSNFLLNKIPNPKNKLFILLGFSIYVVIMLLTDTSCPFNKFLGIICPGCGMTRALISALHLDFARAFDYHMMFWSVPLIFLYFIFEGKLFRNKWADRIILIVLSVGFLVNWIFSILYGIG